MALPFQAGVFNRNYMFLYQQNGPPPWGPCPALVGEFASKTQLLLTPSAGPGVSGTGLTTPRNVAYQQERAFAPVNR